MRGMYVRAEIPRAQSPTHKDQTRDAAKHDPPGSLGNWKLGVGDWELADHPERWISSFASPLGALDCDLDDVYLARAESSPGSGRSDGCRRRSRPCRGRPRISVRCCSGARPSASAPVARTVAARSGSRGRDRCVRTRGWAGRHRAFALAAIAWNSRGVRANTRAACSNRRGCGVVRSGIGDRADLLAFEHAASSAAPSTVIRSSILPGRRVETQFVRYRHG